MNKTTTKQRSSNIELYRIIVMLLIVAHHYVVNSNLLDLLSKDEFSFRPLYFYVLGMWGKIGINCFVLITGYFMCTSRITLRKFLKLVLEVEFYNISIYLLFVIWGYQDFSIIDFSRRIWLVWRVQDGFTTCYLLFYLFIPFLNVFIDNLSQIKHKYFLYLTLSIYSVLPSIPHIRVDMNYLTWFCLLYMISSYIRKYEPRALNVLSNLVGVFSIVLIALLSVVVLRYVSIKMNMNLHYFFVMDVNKVVGLVTSIVLFNYFRNINIPSNKLINAIAATTFGIYLIHTNSDSMREWLWIDIIDVCGHYAINHYIFYSLFFVIAIFIVASLIDYLRIKTIEKWFFLCYDRCIQRKDK